MPPLEWGNGKGGELGSVREVPGRGLCVGKEMFHWRQREVMKEKGARFHFSEITEYIMAVTVLTAGFKGKMFVEIKRIDNNYQEKK